MKKRRPSTALQVGGLLLLAVVLTGTAYAYIHTVVTGYIDIVHYYNSARALLAATTPITFFHALFQWAPLFPALFALVLRWGGPSAVYFINPPVVALLIAGMGVWTWRLRRDYAAAVLTVLLAAILFLTSQGRVSVYMLYPFREPLSFLFIWGGMLLALAAGRASGRRADLLWLLSGCAYVLAAAVREPSIFALTGAIAYALAQSRTPWPRRWRHAALAAAPFLVAAFGLVLLAGFTGITGSAQFSGWRNMTAGLTWDAWQNMLFRYLHWWRLMCGWPGLVLAGLGLAHLGRTRETAWWLLVPPLLITLGFYAGFAVSSRYALSSAIYLVPLAALGARWTVHGLARALRRGQPWVERGLLAILIGFLLFHAFQGMLRVDPRERVSRSDMNRFRVALATYVPPGCPVATEYRARHLFDALTTQLAIPQTGAPHFIAEVTRHGPGYFLQPLTPASLSQAKVPFPNISFEERIRQQLDIHPVTDARNQPVTMTLGPGAYALLRVTPWQQGNVTQDLTAAHCAGQMFWLNFRASDPQARRRVSRLDAQGRIRQVWELPAGHGLMPFALDEPVLPAAPARLRVESSAPLPATLLAEPTPSAGPLSFWLGPGRLLSVLEWIVPPTQRGNLAQRWAAIISHAGAVALPRPQGWTTGHYHITFEIESFRRRPDEAVFQYVLGEQILGVFTNRLTRRRFRHSISLAPTPPSNPLEISIQVAGNVFDGNHFRLVALELRLDPPPP